MIKAKKSLGQNFLRSGAALRALIEGSGLLPGEHVLEIGPGEGVLTRALLDEGARVTAIEKDHRLIDPLRQKFHGAIEQKKLSLYEGDAAEHTSIDMVLSEAGLSDKSFRLIANIPYYLTGLIIRRFLDESPRPKSMTLMVQKEVADEMLARDGKEGILSVAVKTYGIPRMVARVPRGAFVPMPNVDSAIVTIDLIADPFENDTERNAFFEFLRAGFHAKRKTLVNNLVDGGYGTKVSVLAMLGTLGIPEAERPERITAKTWLQLYRYATKQHEGNNIVLGR